MIQFLLSLLPASLFIYGLNILFQEDHLLEKLGEKLRGTYEEPWRDYYAKPLFDCAICMSSVWGTIWFFIGLELFFQVEMPIKLWIPFCLCLCGLNTIINKLTSKERIILEE